MTLIAQTLLVLHITHNGVAVGLMAACQFLPVLVFGAWAGVIADRSDKRQAPDRDPDVRHGAVVRARGVRVHERPAVDRVLRCSRSPAGFATAFDNPARRSFVVEMVPETYVPTR